MQKLITIILSVLIVFALVQPAFAADTLLPESEIQNCEQYMSGTGTFGSLDVEGQKNLVKDPATRNNVLGCAIETGKINLWMLPFYITFIIEFLIGLVGLVSVLFVIIGGYFYATGGLTEDKEKGKKTVMYALVGMALAILSWIIVNIIQTQLTS